MDYPFRRCLNPRTVYNKATGQTIISRCGCCAACLSARASQMTQLCKLEEKSHTFCYFVTLTYRNSDCPTVECVPYIVNKQLIGYFLNDKTKRNDTYNELIEFVPVERNKHIQTSFKAACHRNDADYRQDSRIIRCVNSRDLQLFLKRLRKQLSKFTDEKIRYYAISEYGPVHFRPHFHLLLFFDSQDIAQNICQVVRASWKFGRVDISRSRGNCAGYVAQYVNGLSTLPDCYVSKSLKPFTRHSNFFAALSYKDDAQKIYQNEHNYFVERVLPTDSTLRIVHPWRSLINLFYPKTYRYNNLDSEQRRISYCLLLYARRQYGNFKTTELAKFICEDITQGERNFVTDYIRCLCNKDYYMDDDTDWLHGCNLDLHTIETTVYNMLVVSKHFLTFVCQGNCSTFHIRQMVNRIADFYSYLDMYNLGNWYQSQVDYLNEFANTDNFVCFGEPDYRCLVNFYDNFDYHDSVLDYPQVWIDFFKSTKGFHTDDGLILWPVKSDLFKNKQVFREFVAYCNSRFDKTIKHKKLHDSLVNWMHMYDYDV